MHLSLPSFLRKYSLPRKAKGNVSLLVIFVLLTSSLMALLAMSQIQNLMSYGNQTFNFFRAHYLAKAGLELSLTEVYLRDPGFSLTINIENDIVTSNFPSGYEGFNPHFSVEITGATKLLTNSIKDTSNCTNENKISIASGASVVVPLFVDDIGNTHSEFISTDSKTKKFLKNEIQQIKLDSPGGVIQDLIFGLFAFSGEEMTDMVTKKGTTLNVFLNDSNTFVLEALRDRPDTQKYLTIVNPSSTPVTFCINSTSNTLLLPSPDTLIRVYAHYGNVEVGLEAVFSKPFPNFLQGLSEFNTDQAT